MVNGAKERLVKEIVELKERYHKLDDFLWSTSFSKLPERQQDLMYLQETFMCGYLDVLEQRLKYWKDKE